MGLGEIGETLLQRLRQDSKSIHTSYLYLMTPFVMIVGFSMMFFFRLPWSVLFVLYGVIPKLDQILPHDWLNPTFEEMKELEKNQKFRAVIYFAIVLDWVAFFIAMNFIYYDEFTPMEMIPVTYLLTNLTASAFLISHELIHKTDILDWIVGNDYQ